jgi:hypothetical protein
MAIAYKLFYRSSRRYLRRYINMNIKSVFAALALGLMLIGTVSAIGPAGSVIEASNSWNGGSLNPTSDLGPAPASTGMAGYYNEAGNYQGWSIGDWMNFLWGGLTGINNGLTGVSGVGSNAAASSSINSGLSSISGSSVGGSSGGNFGF